MAHASKLAALALVVGAGASLLSAGAPGGRARALDGPTCDASDDAVAAHPVHGQDTPIRRAISCAECHAPATQVCAPGQVPGRVVVFGALAQAGGASPEWDPVTRTCTGAHCHGATMRSPSGPVAWVYVEPDFSRPPQELCAGCHGYPPPPPHFAHTGCAGCHPATVLADGTVDVAGGKHIDGAVQVGAGGGGECGACHGIPPETGSHARHVGVQGYGCAACHAGDGHFNGSVDVILGAPWGGEYLGTPEPGDAFGACANVSCHGDGTSVATGVVSASLSPPWGGPRPACTGCHGFPPLYAQDAPKSNSHFNHQGYGCGTCHQTTTADGVTIAGPSHHANGAYDVAPAPGVPLAYAYDRGGGTCTIACHHPLTWGNEYFYVYPALGIRRDLCYGVDFSVRISGGTGRSPFTFEWDFADGTTATQGPVDAGVSTPVLTHLYPGPGPWDVVVTARDADHHRDVGKARTSALPRNDPPVAASAVTTFAMTARLVDLSTDLDADLCGHSGNGTIWVLWGDGRPAESRSVALGRDPTGETFSHVYSYAGTYTVTHTVVDNVGSQASSASVRVTVPTTSVSVSGRITHAGGGGYLPGAPFSGVSVQLRRTDGSLYKSAVTDASGAYVLSKVADGACYLVKPAKAGFIFSPAQVSGICATAEHVDFVGTP